MASATAPSATGYAMSVARSPSERRTKEVPSSEKRRETVLVARPKRPMKAA